MHSGDSISVYPPFSISNKVKGIILQYAKKLGLGIGIVAEIEGLEKYKVRITHPDWLTGGRHIYLMRHRTRMMTYAAQQLMNRILEQGD